MNDDTFEHMVIAELLSQHVNGTLNTPDQARAEAHLAQCAACRHQEAVWRTVAVATKTHLTPQAIERPAPALFDAILTRIDAPMSAGISAEHVKRVALVQARHVWQLVRVQAALLPKGIWIPSAFALALAFLTGSVWHGISFLPTLLGLVVPLVTAIGTALSYGPEHDPAFELALTTPTSPRMVLLCRLGLVYGYNTVLALGVTLLLALLRVAPFTLLASAWIGPMLLLGGLSLVVSLVSGAVAGVGAAVGVILLRLLAATLDSPGSRFSQAMGRLEAVWRTSPTVIVLAVLTVVLAAWITSREPRLE